MYYAPLTFVSLPFSRDELPALLQDLVYHLLEKDSFLGPSSFSLRQVPLLCGHTVFSRQNTLQFVFQLISLLSFELLR